MTAALQQTENSSSYSSGELKLLLVPPGAAGPYLEGEIERHLAAAVAMIAGYTNIEQILEFQRTGINQIWLCMEGSKVIAVAVTEIVEYKVGRKVLKATMAGGDKGSIQKACFDCGGMKRLEEFALEQGCHSIFVEGRRGWKRLLPDYKEVWATFEKEL